jgi:hypothetical protein
MEGKKNLGRSSADRGALMSYEHWLAILCNTEHTQPKIRGN